MAQAPTWSGMTDNLIMANSFTSHPHANTGWIGRTRWTYVQLSNGDTIIDPMMGFYLQPPPGALCAWSTNYGRRMPVFFNKNELRMPLRKLTKWNDEKLTAVGAMYTARFWHEMRYLARPETFEDLYRYFDSATLWRNGAYNMWNLINMLVTLAHERWPVVLADWKMRIDSFVDDCIHTRPGALHNQEVLRQWDGERDLLQHVRGFHDWPYDEIITTFDLQQQNMVREALICQYINECREQYNAQQYNPPQYYPYHPRPDATVTAIPVTATIEAAPRTAAARTGPLVVSSVPINAALPTTPATAEQNTGSRTARPASASLTSIPEELAASKSDATATKDSDETTKTEVIASSASEGPIPEIVTKDATPPRDNIIRDRKDSNGSTDRLFFDPTPSSGSLEAQSRQLSISSAPGEESEPMLNESDLNAQKRVASEAPPAVSRQNSSTSQQKLKGAKRNGKQGSGSGSRKEHFKDAPMYRPGQQLQQHGPPPHMKLHGSHPSQQVMPHIGSQQNALSSPLFAPGQTNMYAGPNGLMPHNQPPPPPDMPLARPPMMPFYDRAPMPPPHVGQSQFGHSNEGSAPTMSCMNMPPPLTGPQHCGPPVYQTNSYIQQFEHQSSPNQSRGSLENRWNNIKSTGSRKVRDDPVHGAVYVLAQPRKINQTKSIGQPRSTNVLHHGSTGPSSCKNLWFKSQLAWRQINELIFNDCACSRCDEATRGVFVRPYGLIDPSDPEGNITRHFAKFGPVSVKFNNKSGVLVVFQNDQSAMSAVQEACANPDKSIKGWTSKAIVWYPFYSRHYTGDTVDNVTGLLRHLYEKRARSSSVNLKARRESNAFRGTQSTGPKLANVDLVSTHRAVQHASAIPQGLIPDPSLNPGKDAPFSPMPLPPQQRQLWVPPPTLPRASAAPASMPLDQRSMSYHMGANQRREMALKKEDWRSKPPSEEALSEDGEDDIAVTDTASDHSCQGAKSVKVSLPSEDGSAREAISRSSSRSATPDADSKPQESVLQQPSEKDAEAKVVTSEPNVTKGGHEDSATNSGTTTPDNVKPVETHKKKALEVSREAQKDQVAIEKLAPQKTGENSTPDDLPEKTSGYRKMATDLTAPVESLVEGSYTGQGSYRKTTGQLSYAVEQFSYPMDTIIRHKQPRAALPAEWATGESASKNPSSVMQEPTDSSEIRNRFGDIGSNHALDEDISETDPSITLEEALEGNMSLVIKTQQAFQTQQPKSGTGRYKKRKLQGGSSQTVVPPQSNTPTDTGSRGPSPALNRPPSSATISGPSRGPSPDMHNDQDNRPAEASGTIRKNKKSKGKRKQTKHTAPKDKQEDTSSENPRSSQPKPLEEKHRPEAIKTTDETQHTHDKQPEEFNNKTEYRADNGGSVSMYKNRSPKTGQKDGSKHKENRSPIKYGTANTTHSAIFEPPIKEKTHSSPEANLFPQQKFSIDQARKATPVPKMSLDTVTRQMSAPKATEEHPKVPTSLPQTTSTTKKPSGAWADIVRGTLKSKDDPFSATKDEDAPKEWMKKSPEKTRTQAGNTKAQADQVSPTPSPEKRSHRPTKSKNKLNAAAQSFTSSRTSSPAPNPRLDPMAKEFTSSHPPSPAMSTVSAANTLGHRKKPSLPGQSSGIDKRLVTPLEQVLDGSQLLQPGPPAKERKNGPLPDRTGGNPNEIPVKNPRPIPANTAAAKSQQPKKEQKQEEDETPSDKGAWRTVLPARNTSTSRGANRGRGGRGGRWSPHGQVGRGRHIGDAEERKGG